MLLNIILLITTLAMLVILALVFFAARLRSLLKAHLYHRTFSFLAVLAVAGILFASMLSFKSNVNYDSVALVASPVAAVK
jgi:uncharacterized membrane protein